MSRRRHESKTGTPNATSPSPVAGTIPLAVLVHRVLLGALTALVVSRPLVAGDDPGRLRLTTSGAELTYNLFVLLVLVATTIQRVWLARSKLVAFDAIPLFLAGVGVVAYISSLHDNRYARPGLYHAWEWCALGAMFYLGRRVPDSLRDTRGLLNALVASAVSVAALGVYQAAEKPLKLPSVALPVERTDLVGNDEFYPEFNRPPTPTGPHGTFDQPATLALFCLLFLPLALLIGRHCLRSNLRLKLLLVVPLLLGGAFVVSMRQTAGSPTVSGESLTLLKQHLSWGVSPGNYSRVSPTHSHTVGSAWVLLLVTTGVFVVPLLGAFVVQVAKTLRQPPVTTDVPMGDVRWEFYYGGIVGLTLGFIWSLGRLPAEATSEETIAMGMVAVGRAVVWFVVFGTLERLTLPTPTVSTALLVGGVLVVLAGFLHDAVLLPTLLSPLVFIHALVLNTRPPKKPVAVAWAQPLAVAAACNSVIVLVLYLLSAAIPGWATTHAVRDARRASVFVAEQERAVLFAPDKAEQTTALLKARNYLRNAITNPLREALRQDSLNASLMLEIARWQRPLYRYQTIVDPKGAADTARDNVKLGDMASKLDPRNLAGERSLYESLITFLQETGALVKPKERTTALNERIRRICEVHPTEEVALRYRMVQALLDGGDGADAAGELTHLWQLANKEGTPHGALTDEQRQSLIRRAFRNIKWHRLPAVMLKDLAK